MQTLIKCCIMWYFIWVFTVCKSAIIGVYHIQRIKVPANMFRKIVSAFVFSCKCLLTYLPNESKEENSVVPDQTALIYVFTVIEEASKNS